MSVERIAVVGGGAWGTALSVHLARLGRRVRLWIHEEDLVARMLARRDNPVFLPGIEVPEGVVPTSSLVEAVRGADLLLCAVPTTFARPVYETMAPHVDRDARLVAASKGIEPGTLALPCDVLSQVFRGRAAVAALSGPSFALEVARALPTALVIASTEPALAADVQGLLSDRTLRVYTNDDPLGVQVAGALKNVIAIAAGILDGVGVGGNTQAALLTRGLAEMARLGVALGGRPDTFAGLAGLGDLVLTCTGDLSRNRGLGRALGRGERLQDAVAHSAHVAEGVATTRSARELALREGVDMPIVAEVHRILYEDGSPREAVERLMTRPLRSEALAGEGETA